MTKPTTIVFFDFDATLVKGDSLWPFLRFAAGWPRITLALAESLALCAVQSWRSDEAFDKLTYIKTKMLRRSLGHISTTKLTASAQKLRGWQTWHEPMRQALLDHHAQGHHIVIASGGLDLYLPELLKDTPHNALICTEMEIKDGFVTGIMSQGNCVRQRKAERVASYIAATGPYQESWGYGNYPHDVPMLSLLKYRVLV